MPEPQDQIMTTARQAWDGFVLGQAQGDWSAFLDMLSEDVTFFVPSPGPFQGENHGKQRVTAFAAHVSRRDGERHHYQEPIRVSREGGTVVFEAWDEGTAGDAATTHRVALSFDVVGAEVIVVREYAGFMD